MYYILLNFIFKKTSPKLSMYIYIYDYAHSFFEVDFEFDALYWYTIPCNWLHDSCSYTYEAYMNMCRAPLLKIN